jgi:hypothetical protein
MQAAAKLKSLAGSLQHSATNRKNQITSEIPLNSFKQVIDK